MKKRIGIIPAAVIVAAAVSFWVYARGGRSVTAAVCDGAFTAAVLWGGIGGLMLIAREGMFDGLGYIGHVILSVFMPLRRERRQYIAYREELRTRRRQAGTLQTPLTFLLCGAGLLAVSAVLAGVSRL